MKNLDVVVITGAGRGIGKAAAAQLGRTGALVLCISRSSNADKTAQSIIADGGRAESLRLDLADYEAAGAAVSAWARNHSEKKFGVVMAAAILGPSGPLSTTDLKGWDLAYRTGVLGNLAVLQALLPGMLQTRFGRIIGFAGGGSAYANPMFPAYSAVKTAMVRVIENVHEDLKDKGDFASVCLAPGAVDTNMLREVRQAGGYVKTTVGMEEPVQFIERFLDAASCQFSGSFVHVRDDYQRHLDSEYKLPSESIWKLRRIES